ncbi:ABC transporter ATP-binding protein [Alloalcanivorax gelatiniphagus]|uniref:ABC transporter ATP-binding protein n=1 Tax=Alloalcanivorax gelatiniphagus TaxID=1194167 RepID=A0ABY2XGY1_9GAMM|nr:ABC transporter ATP-binding protein [Alloalcanivorax gelatiniphagus]TMW10934.1 ABC transporter ATP-binding protein [Alloalcanivorax gelatiniphagus]
MINTPPPPREEPVPGGQRPFVELTNVSLTYGDFGEGLLALQDFHLSVQQGEFTALVGPSGCGKSTTLKLISGLRQPDSGGVIVAGKEVSKPLKIVGMAFQNPTLLPWRTSLDNVLLPLEIVEPHRRSFRKERARHAERAMALFEKVGLKDVADRFPWQLSGGMQQRVSLCRSLIHEPDLLLLDEPFGALDAFTREDLWDTMKALWEEQRFTAVLITHDLTESVYMAESVHVLSARPGRIVHSQRIPPELRRDRDARFSPAFADAVYQLRQHVGHAQEDPV